MELFLELFGLLILSFLGVSFTFLLFLINILVGIKKFEEKIGQRRLETEKHLRDNLNEILSKGLSLSDFNNLIKLVRSEEKRTFWSLKIKVWLFKVPIQILFLTILPFVSYIGVMLVNLYKAKINWLIPSFIFFIISIGYFYIWRSIIFEVKKIIDDEKTKKEDEKKAVLDKLVKGVTELKEKIVPLAEEPRW